MQLDTVTDLEQLAALSDQWSTDAWYRLATPSPMQSHAWLTTWWQSYADASRELLVVAARHEGQLVGVAPWYVETRRGRRVLRWLGDGHVCSDHPTLLASETTAASFAHQLAEWLLHSAADQWDELALESIDDDDPTCRHFVDALTTFGCLQVRRDEPGSCYVDLPATFDDYLMSVSKNHRKRCRKWEKQYFQTGRAKVHIATTADDCLAHWQTLVELHNARRAELGEQGAFHDPQFAEFHQTVIPRLATDGRLQLRVLAVDSQPVAAEYVLCDDDTWYAYQSGLSKTGESLSAGSLSVLKLVEDAIAAGYTKLDLLRGTESYKFSWGAQHRPASTIVLRPPTSMARLITLGDSALLAAKRLRRSLVGTGQE